MTAIADREATIRARPSLTPEQVQRRQVRCDHYNNEMRKTAIARYGNVHGRFARCAKCQAKWRWNDYSRQWDTFIPKAQMVSSQKLPLPSLVDPSSLNRGSSATSAAAYPAAAPKSRPRPTTGPVRQPLQEQDSPPRPPVFEGDYPMHDQPMYEVPTFPMTEEEDGAAEYDYDQWEQQSWPETTPSLAPADDQEFNWEDDDGVP